MSLEDAINNLADAIRNSTGVAAPTTTLHLNAPAAATEEKPKRGRPVAAKKEETPVAAPAEPEADPFADVPAAPAKEFTQDEVRAALVAAKTRFEKAGLDAKSAQTKAIAILKTAGESDTLPGLKKEKYAAVVKAAEDAK